MKVTIQYRCGGNYKTNFDHVINLPDFPEASKLEVGSEIEMGEYGTLPESDFFDSDTFGHKYDEDLDHNILEIVEIKEDQK